jgi:HJR/Mrr/RecB family endonuclease
MITTGIGLEKYVQKVLERHRFGVKTTRKTRDQGADLIMNKGGV